MLTLSYRPYTLHFRFEAGTSRGVMTQHQIYYLFLHENQTLLGVGEVAPLPQLSIEATPNFKQNITKVCTLFNQQSKLFTKDNLLESFLYKSANQLFIQQFPSIFFALETVFLGTKNGNWATLFDNDFIKGQTALAINGLIWMGKPTAMLEQIENKLAQGYRCLKMKIGAIHFEDEIAILRGIRQRFSPQEITLRVDANGAFLPTDALEKLKRLADLQVHSIEQPIKPQQWEAMQNLCATSPLPIALDEELIGIQSITQKEKLLQTIRPAFIILKPTLLGGFAVCDEWIQLADKLGIGWWLTSALESNIGLNAIAQYTAQKILSTPLVSFPQGLGTGQLYHNNIASPLVIESGNLHYKGIFSAPDWFKTPNFIID